MPVALDRYYTRKEVLAFPRDENRYELVYGELLVSPVPVVPHVLGDRCRHQARGSLGTNEHHARVRGDAADMASAGSGRGVHDASHDVGRAVSTNAVCR